jgi:hypothetical protein
MLVNSVSAFDGEVEKDQEWRLIVYVRHVPMSTLSQRRTPHMG